MERAQRGSTNFAEPARPTCLWHLLKNVPGSRRWCALQGNRLELSWELPLIPQHTHPGCVQGWAHNSHASSGFSIFTKIPQRASSNWCQTICLRGLRHSRSSGVLLLVPAAAWQSLQKAAAMQELQSRRWECAV